MRKLRIRWDRVLLVIGLIWLIGLTVCEWREHNKLNELIQIQEDIECNAQKPVPQFELEPVDELR